MVARSLLGPAALALLCLAPLAGPAAAQGFQGPQGPQDRQNRWDWNGGRDDDRRAYDLAGPGVGLLIPELRDTRRGKAFVLRNFDFDHNGRINRREAQAANEAFLAVAGRERDRFDWDRYADRGPPPPPRAGRPDGPERDRFQPGRRGDRQWNRQGMREYRMRQGRYGAMFTIDDVLFETGKSVLRPAAQAKLEPLADYLDANPGVRVRLDGFTDSVGSDAANLRLSHNRAKAVAAALATLGVPASRVEFYGNGEKSPVASNNTAGGRQLNRRVEVTLLGQRASAFN
jgi:outer membrane protein OmpA-like peptidoglycan-associated protein